MGHMAGAEEEKSVAFSVVKLSKKERVGFSSVI